MYKKLNSSELIKQIDIISKEIFDGNNTPWVIFPSVTITREDFEKYSKRKNKIFV